MIFYSQKIQDFIRASMHAGPRPKRCCGRSRKTGKPYTIRTALKHNVLPSVSSGRKQKALPSGEGLGGASHN